MADILVHHCKLHVVRHGGWSWGQNPHQLLEKATKALPELIAKQLADLFPDDNDLDIMEPLRLAYKIQFNDLYSARGSLTETCARQPQPALFALAHMRSTTDLMAQTNESTARAPAQNGPLEAQKDAAFTSPNDSFLFLLLSWSRQGKLEHMLNGFTAHALVSWHDYLFSQLPQTATEGPRMLVPLAREVTAMQKAAPADPQAAFRLRIILATEILRRQGTLLSGPLLRQALDEVFSEADLSDRLPATPSSPESVDSPKRRMAHTAIAHLPAHKSRPFASDGTKLRPGSASALKGDVHVCSVLPFLMLGVLSRLGYLDVLSATLQAAGLERDAIQFATALAYKVLPAPKRGWHREPEARRAAAAFAGLNESLQETGLNSFGQRIADECSPLDRFIAVSLAEGHNPNQPLLLHGIGSPANSLVLCDVEGCFLVDWHEDLSAMLDTIRMFGPVTVLVTDDAATPAVLRQLSEANIRFITTVPPSRGENWRRFNAPEHYWTNDHERHKTQLRRIAGLLPQAIRGMETLISALITDRQAIVPTETPALERSVTLASAAALGTIAWILWHEHEATDPVLALERFADLDGRISFDSDTVRVRVPLGRRHQDLRKHGFLADIANVPWLNGRVVEFPGT
jgi:hypothetical protein